MSNLSKEEKKSFVEAMLSQAFAADTVMVEMADPVFEKSKVVFSDAPSQGDLSGKLIPIATYDDLFKLLGLPDSEKNSLPVMSPVYPCEANLIAGEELYIRQGQCIQVGTDKYPTVMVFGTITIETGGQLLVTGNTAINCQLFNQF